MYCYNGYMAVIGELFGMAGLEQSAQERAVFGYYHNEVNIPVFYKLADGVKEIILPDERELRFIILEHGFQFFSFSLVFTISVKLHAIKSWPVFFTFQFNYGGIFRWSFRKTGNEIWY